MMYAKSISSNYIYIFFFELYLTIFTMINAFKILYQNINRFNTFHYQFNYQLSISLSIFIDIYLRVITELFKRYLAK